MRERAFAVLGDRITRTRFLDLYAGTGAVGLEALSRGARSVVFVERHRSAALLIQKNCASFDLTADRAELLVRRVDAAIAQLSRRSDCFDIAWADPPFEDWQDGLQTLSNVFGVDLMGAGNLACLECPSNADVAGSLPPDLEIVRDLTGSASRVVMIEKAGNAP
jgi:16S rRNA (guanine(966)-N(2))-methyltransferase RsmD